MSSGILLIYNLDKVMLNINKLGNDDKFNNAKFGHKNKKLRVVGGFKVKTFLSENKTWNAHVTEKKTFDMHFIHGST